MSLEPFGAPLFPFTALCSTMNVEIAYLYKEDKDSENVLSWTYFHANTDDIEKATRQATTYFKSFVKSNGWTKKATLKEIIPMRHTQDEITSTVVSTDAVPPAGKRGSAPRRKATPARTASKPSPRKAPRTRTASNKP
jgi:hypothetical protein